jgi:uncharacterized damage-inducible protein DinB
MSHKTHFLTKFCTEAMRTQRLARVFADAVLALRPGEGSMSTAELLAHIVSSRNFLRGVFSESQPTTELFHVPVDTATVNHCLRELAQSYRAVKAALEACDETILRQRIAPFGPAWEMTRLELAQLMLEHEIHHRGQLSVYARVAGKVPPDMYAPVTEEIFDDSSRG